MRKISLALSASAFIVAGWSLLWGVAAREAAIWLDDAIAKEQQRGRVWTCTNQVIGGYPFAITVSCDGLAVTGLVLAETSRGAVGALTIRVGLPDPRHATITLAPPFSYRDAAGETDLKIGWSVMTIDLDGLASGAPTTTVTGADIALTGQFGASGGHALAASSGIASVSKVPDAASPTFDFAIALKGAEYAPLDQLIGEAKPTDATLIGQVDQAVFTDGKSSTDLIDRWRKAGGMIDFATIRLSRDTSALEAKGSLGLDAQHRPRGNLDATFTGAGPILRRYGINPTVAAAGSILNSLFGKRRDDAKPHVIDANVIELPIKFRDGSLGIGPIQLPVALPPLY